LKARTLAGTHKDYMLKKKEERKTKYKNRQIQMNKRQKKEDAE
jgi:hypothetical protein